MAFNLTFDVIELARLQSSITGVLAGFALTVVILLMGQRAEGASADSSRCHCALAAHTFICHSIFLSHSVVDPNLQLTP